MSIQKENKEEQSRIARNDNAGSFLFLTHTICILFAPGFQSKLKSYLFQLRQLNEGCGSVNLSYRAFLSIEHGRSKG